MRRLVLLLLMASLGLAGQALGQEQARGQAQPQEAPPNQAQEATIDQQLSDWDGELSAIEAALSSDSLDHREQGNRRTALLRLAQDAQAQAGSDGRSIEGITRLLDALGPGPAEGAPPEEASIQEERAKLVAELTTLQAQKGRADLVVAKANLLLTQLDQARLAVFAQELLTPSPSLLSQSTWASLPGDLAALRSAIAARATPGHDDDGDRRLRRILLGLGALAVALASWPLSRWLRRQLDRRRAPVVGIVPFRYRALATLVETALRFFVPFMATLFLLFMTLAAFTGHRLDGLIEPSAIAVTSGATLTFLLLAAGKATIAPHMPNWRLLDLAQPSALALHRRWILASVFLGGVVTLRFIVDDLEPQPALRSLLHSGEALIGGFLLLSLLPARLWYSDADLLAVDAAETAEAGAVSEEQQRGDSNAWLGQARYLRLLSLLVALVVLVAAVLGYIALSDYVALIFLSAFGIGFLFFVLRAALREAVHAKLFQHLDERGGWRRLFFRTERGANFFELLLFVVLDFILIFLALFTILPLAGIAEEELQVWLYSLLQGFTVAGVTIKPLNIVLALFVFVLILAMTRLVQRRIRGRFFSAINLENSIQQSVSAGIGYVGVIAAILIAINVVGVDLTNLALIAGALSVGIGFGLQNIVSNFVSGLILLIERPIKVGDWVVVGPNEGIVKRISVRATEVQTWQRSSVIIPNSDLVTTAVVNWTHKDRIGRLDIPVRVPYGTDPKAVHDLLLEAAGDSKPVLRFPAAYVYFKSFSPDGMDFDIRVYVPDIYDLFISVANDVRFAIVRRFADAGIEMALPRRIVHVADLERLDLTLSKPSYPQVPDEEPDEASGKPPAAHKTPPGSLSGKLP
ncbi:MAG: hypothetical protein Kilf2KO_29340 [Rhodospirillales bacterium]